jgi:hypothetical protein
MLFCGVRSSSVLACLPCPALEGSIDGSAACYPGVVSVVASNPPPVQPGLTVGDQIMITFTNPTNQPPVGNLSVLSNLLQFSASLGSALTGTWMNNGKFLSVLIVDPSTVNIEVSATRWADTAYRQYRMFIPYGIEQSMREQAWRSRKRGAHRECACALCMRSKAWLAHA